MALKVSVIIINWNTKEHLMTCVRSFTDAGVQENLIVVVDQSSSDGSVEALRAGFPAVRVIVTDGTPGYGECVNRAFPLIQTEVFVVSNADVIIERDCLTTMEREFAMDRRVALAGCEVRNSAGVPVTRFTRLSIFRAILLEVIPRSLRGTWRDFQIALRRRARGAFDVSYVEGAFMMLRTRLFEEIGGFDIGFTFFFEDADLPIRFRKAGLRVIHIPTAVVTHVGGASFSQVPHRHAAEFNKNLITFYERHAPRRAVWLRRAFLCILFLKCGFLRLASLVARTAEGLNGRIEVMRVKRESLARLLPPNDGQNGVMDPRVSVVIPTANREEPLFALVDSLRKQTYPPYEVLIIDQSQSVSQAKEALYDSLKPPFKFIRTASRGRPTAKNIGILHAKGDILLFCDDDFEPPSDLIQVHVESFREPRIGGVSCRHTEENLPNINSKRILRVTWFGQMLDGYQSNITARVGTLTGPNMSIQRNVVRQTGYFEPLLTGTSIFEEPEYSERIRSKGYDILFTNRTYGIHRPQGDGNRSIRKDAPVQYYRDFHHNEMVYFLKNRNHALLLFVIPFCFLRSIKQAMIARAGVGGALRMFTGVFAGIASYYRSLR